MESHENPGRAADDSLREMQEASDELAERVETVRGDWERKQQDASVPGAEPGGSGAAESEEESEQAGGEVAGDWEGEGPAAGDAGQ